jgi:hypothetical protein
MLHTEISFCQPFEKTLLEKIHSKYLFNFKDMNINEKSFDDAVLKEAFKQYLLGFLTENEKNTCLSCWKNLSKTGNKFFNFKTENFIKKIKDLFLEIKIFREEVFKLFEKILNDCGNTLEITNLKKDALFLVNR